ncbi:DUF1345 domain-containing protein [Rhizobium sp. LC145]|uniref:DUF1345 domain-containing protein n=1 Tax=Rhizobium sp. LC145 TaxID=1120688 RepID=UPI00062A00A0|nr:DUF1345 domain-containing protein [Rhizobium sp. LC145]KKX33719.1 membrane protein [Rhizobium sp. LC145]TKT55315.1 DUF1345 domain-containing protein [Rhizobiaceae bacterium LC148]
MTSLWQRLRHQRHGPFYAGTVVALVCLPFLLFYAPRLAPGVTVVVFFLIYLGLMAERIPRLTPALLRRRAERDDEPAPVILAVTLLAVVAAIISLFSVLNRQLPAGPVEIVIAFVSVALGWLTIHIMFAMHYAHLYWRPEPAVEAERGGKGKRGGLTFPRTADPSGWEFLYFAFVIGMTAQTSDVVITTTAMRRINLVHAVVSFFFNTVLVAASVNAVVALAG